ncbi:MAG: stage II sporulation protein M [Patescibacteria group bacterium]|jgi:uncharacterized membrane protein SpoIIM required for sporulation
MFKRTGTIWSLITALLALTFVIGSFVGWFLPDTVKIELLTTVLAKFSTIIANSSTDWHLAVNIFLNNILVAGLVFISALIPPITLIIIIGNGLIVGIFGDLLLRMDTLQPGTWQSGVLGVLPHGLVELGAIFFAGSLGLTALLKLLWPRLIDTQLTRGQFILKSFRWLGLVVIPLLVCAALIETFISPKLIEASLPTQNDAAFAPTIDHVALAKTGCTPSQPLASIDDISLLYNPDIMALLQQRSQVRQWQVSYQCPNDGGFNIASFDKQAWSTIQATNLIKQLLDKLQANYTVKNQTIKTSLHHKTVIYKIIETDQLVIIITQSTLQFAPENLLTDRK